MALKGSRESVVSRDIPSLELRAAVAPATINPKSRTVDVTWSTGAKVRRTPWFDEPYDEELSMDPAAIRMGFLNSGKAPVLDSHDNYSGANGVIGVIESARTDGKIGTATLRFAKAEDDPEADQIFRKISDGIIANVSVGYRVHKMERVPDAALPPGQPKGVPIYRAVDWEPFEISPVGIPADKGADFRSARAGTHPTNRCQIITRTEDEPAMDKTAAELEADRIAQARATAAQAEANRAAETARLNELAEARAAGAAAEQTRGVEIRKVVARAKLPVEFADKLIGDAKIDMNAARAAVLEELAKGSEKDPIRGHNIVVGNSAEVETRVRQAEVWLLTKAGRLEVVRAAAKAHPDKFPGFDVAMGPGGFRNMTQLDLVKEFLEQRGVSVRGRDPEKLIAEAMQPLNQRSIGPSNSTSDFPNVLENTLHKLLLASYLTTPDTWSKFCLTGSVSDFRAHKRYRYGSFGVLDDLGEGGEIKNKSIPDATRESITAKTKANIIAISRQSIINDDMDVFSRLAMLIGRAARLTVEVDVYSVLSSNAGLGPVLGTDAKTLFHADHGNIGVSAAISVASLALDKVLMASQKDQDGNEILDIRPEILVLPIALGVEARVINDAQYDPTAATALMRPNAMRAQFSQIVDTPRLTGTKRYMFANPNAAPVLEVAFLNGMTDPFLENRLGWQVDGTEWKVRLDYGVAGIDFKGAVLNAGV